MLRKMILGLAAAVAFSSCTSGPDEDEVRKKVGQMFLLAFSGQDAESVRPFVEERGIGGLYLSNENLGSPREAAELLNELQESSIKGISGLPLLTAGDQEGAWGVMVPYSSTGPGNMALGAAPVAITEKMYRSFASEIGAVGMFCNLSPVADVNSNPENPIIGTRSFGEDPKAVAERVRAAVRGLHAHDIIATAKHFPGHGNTATDSHSGLPRVSRTLEEIEQVDLLPFKAAIEAGVDMVMTAHIIYEALDPDHPATLSGKILKGYLREKLGFEGVIITDSFNMWAIQKNYDPGEAAVQAILAGADMIMLAEERYGEEVGDYRRAQMEMIDHVEQAVLKGEIPMKRIDEAYERIVSLKEKYRLAERLPVDPEVATEIVGAREHQQVALEAAEAALIARNPQSVFPLPAGAEITVVRLAEEDVAEIIRIAEGIGPNYANAYNDFVTELKKAGYKVNDREFPLQTNPSGDPFIIAVSENYPLPGKSLGLGIQRKRLQALIELAENPVIHVALKDPYDMNDNDPDAYIGAIGANIWNVKAAVNLLAGKAEAKGQLPVTPIR
jgi:beta-N-acetylhexosaminidase